MSDSHKNYLLDLGSILKELALDAMKSKRAAKGTDREAFENGRQLAYYEVIDLMKQQAKVFQIPLSDLRLDDIDPDKDLL